MPVRLALGLLCLLLPGLAGRTAAARELTLGAAVEGAIRQHDRLKASHERIVGREAELDAERAVFDATSSAGLSAEHGERYLVSGARTLTGAVGLAKRLRIGTALEVGVDYELVSADGPADGAGVAGIGVRVDQPLFGGIGEAAGRARERAAEAGLANARSDHDEATTNRIREVAVRYWALVSAQAVAAKLVEAQARADKLLKETRVLVRAHERPATDLHMLEANSAGHAHNQIAAERAVSDAAYALAHALGGGEAPVAITALPEVSPNAPGGEHDDSWVRRALRTRPRLAAHRHRVAAANAALVAAVDEAKPRLDLALDLRHERLDVDPALAAVDGSSVRLSVQSDLPFSNPVGDARQRAARAALREAKALHKAAKREVAVQVRRALTALRAGHAVLKQAESARTAYVQALRAERAKLKAGFSTVFQVTILEDRLTTAELLRLQAWGRYMADVTRMWFATGALVGLQEPGDSLLSIPPADGAEDG